MADFDPDSHLNVETEALNKVVDLLARRFDTVQIFVTRHDPETGDTLAGDWAAGNYYARRGQVAEWLASDQSDDVVRFLGDDAEAD